LSVGGVLVEAWRLYRRFFWRGLAIATPLFTIFTLPQAFVDTLHDTTWTVATASFLVSLSTSYGDFLVEGFLAEDTREHRRGLPPPRFRDLPHRMGPRLLALLNATLIYSICFTVGLGLFIVPGLLVLTYWSVIVPVIVLEGLGIRDSFRRSYRVVKGSFWPVFWTVVILFGGSAFLETGFDNLLFWLPEFYASWLGHVVVGALTAPYAAHALMGIYFRLVDFPQLRSS
jgi:hypothetical protein